MFGNVKFWTCTAVIIASTAVSFSSLAAEEAEARLLRFPAIYGDQLVFSYAGDLYTVGVEGGVARRLTSDVGTEIFPKFSPDGKTLAFTAHYDGNSEVYLMPSEGGEPVRISWTPTLRRDDVSDRMGPNNIVMGWMGNDKVIFRSRGLEFNDWKGRLLLAPIDGGMTEQLPLSNGGWCSLSPDGKKLAYNRVFREFRTWKRYRGGQAEDIWVYDFESGKTVNITENPAQDIFPMWYGSRIYFVSDRDENKRMNLYYHDLESGKTEQVTDFTEYDIKYPSLCDKVIAFENGGYIYKVDLSADSLKAERISIRIEEDLPQRRTQIKRVDDYIAGAGISPDGKRAVFTARGDVFTVPAKYGETRNLTQSCASHERDAAWSPNGEWIAYISDISGEDEIWIQAEDGNASARQLTQGGNVYKYSFQWSPDSSKIAWSDRAQKLWYVDLESGEMTEVAYSPVWEIRSFSWSPDSQWIAWQNPEAECMERIYLYHLESKVSQPVTEGWYASGSPVFSADGKYLYFVSARDFNPISSNTEFNYAYFDMEKIYLITLAAETESPFRPLSDEVEKSSEKTESAESDESEESQEEEPIQVKVDFDGIQDRIEVLPIRAASYSGLSSVGQKLYYLRDSNGESGSELLVYDLEERKETSLGFVEGYELTPDGKKMLAKLSGESYGILDTPDEEFEMENLDLSGLEMTLDLRAEWRQIFNECWRQMRDFVYDPNLHGVNWSLMRERYSALLDSIAIRQDLTYVIGEMIGELNMGHAYVGGGDYQHPRDINVGLLGADIVKDDQSGAFRIEKIYRGQNWNESTRSPLTGIGVNAQEGDYILAINGKCTREIRNIYQALNNTAGKQVKLRLNSVPEEEGSREVVVVPIDDEQSLRYYYWVQQNIEKVNQATGGRVGYIHLPDMGTSGMNEFVKHFYPQLRKEALIIDVRGNGGGNVSQQVMERLLRNPVMVEIVRNTIPGWETMQVGPKICLLDEFTASDGDIFSYRFKHYKIGPLIGKRSWGGVVGIRGSLPLVDGGSLNKPEFSRYGLDGKEWIMEGHGVDPDIEVENDPAREFLGEDDQLSRGIVEILKLLEINGVKIPPPPAYPDKSK